MIFAAGLGTRLYPLTAHKPKALVKINGETLLATAIQKMIDANIHDIVINVHHYSGLIKEYLQQHSFHAQISVSDETAKLLDTAGGLKFAEPLLQGADHILLYNVDILSNINLAELVNNHIEQENLATLAVRDRSTSRYFLFDKNTKQLGGWENVKTGEQKIVYPMENPVALAFSGIHIVQHKILDFIPMGEVLSMTPLYLSLALQHPIRYYLHQQDTWMDVGKYEEVRHCAE